MDFHTAGLITKLTAADRPVDCCNWCLGFFDGFMAGPNGVDQAGDRHSYNPDLLGDPQYDAGAAVGLVDRRATIRWATTA